MGRNFVCNAELMVKIESRACCKWKQFSIFVLWLVGAQCQTFTFAFVYFLDNTKIDETLICRSSGISLVEYFKYLFILQYVTLFLIFESSNGQLLLSSFPHFFWCLISSMGILFPLIQRWLHDCQVIITEYCANSWSHSSIWVWIRSMIWSVVQLLMLS